MSSGRSAAGPRRRQGKRQHRPGNAVKFPAPYQDAGDGSTTQSAKFEKRLQEEQRDAPLPANEMKMVSSRNDEKINQGMRDKKSTRHDPLDYNLHRPGVGAFGVAKSGGF